MGNGFHKVYLDNKADATKKATNDNPVCRSSNSKMTLFDELHNHSFYIFPQKLIGFGATVSHKVGKHSSFSHTANVDILSETKEKRYLLDIQWFGCEQCHYAQSDLSKHIGRLVASLSFNPIEYFPNSQTLSLKNLGLHYTTDNVTTGIWVQNFVLGDKRILTSLSDPHEIAKHCTHVGAEITYAMSPSILIGFRAKRSGFDNGYARIDTSNTIACGARVTLPSNAAVFSARVGEGAIDLHISTSLFPHLQVAVAMHSSLTNAAKNSVDYGFKLTLPEESAMINVAVDNHWKVEASIKKQISTSTGPIFLVATSAFTPTAYHNYSHKFGFGVEVNI